MKQEKKAEPQKVFMKCRNPKCSSIEAIEVKYHPGTRLYRCAGCSQHVAIPVGGKIDLRSL